MDKVKWCSIGVAVMMTVLPARGLALAADGAPMTPELAAKREMVRKREEQRITPQKRQAAAEALKAERLKVYNAKKAARQLEPGTAERK